jgi:hypothetical protein
MKDQAGRLQVQGEALQSIYMWLLAMPVGGGCMLLTRPWTAWMQRPWLLFRTGALLMVKVNNKLQPRANKTAASARKGVAAELPAAAGI